MMKLFPQIFNYNILIISIYIFTLNYFYLVIPMLSLFFSLIFQLQTEIKIHRTLRHTYVCKFERFFEDNTNVYIVLELCSNNVSNIYSSMFVSFFV